MVVLSSTYVAGSLSLSLRVRRDAERRTMMISYRHDVGHPVDHLVLEMTREVAVEAVGVAVMKVLTTMVIRKMKIRR